MNFDKVTNPTMKAFFQRLSQQIDKSTIPDGPQTPMAIDTPQEEPEEIRKMKEEIAQLKQDLDSANSSVSSLTNTVDAKQKVIESLQDKVNVAETVNGSLQKDNEQLELQVSELKNKIPEDGTFSIPQLIEASNRFLPDEGDVILRFLQTFVANESGDAMQQIKAAKANLDARKSSIPSSGETFKSTVKINDKKYSKIDLIRIINALCSIDFFASTDGKSRFKGKCFLAIGNALNVDLSDYNNDLSRSMQDNTKLDKHMEIFKLMANAMEEYFNER